MGSNGRAALLHDRLPAPTRLLGLPTVLAEVRIWRGRGSTVAEPVRAGMAVYWLDGSGMDPKVPELRVVAWAVAWRVGEAYQTAAGAVAGCQTVGRAELTALLAALRLACQPARFVTDCKAVSTGFRSIVKGRPLPSWLDNSAMSDLWLQVHQLVQARGGGDLVQWVPAHSTQSQVLAAGGTAEDHAVNDLVDRRAKAMAAWLRAPARLRTAFAAHKQDAKRAQILIAREQLAILKSRPRTSQGQAAKGRKRKHPALPRALQQRKKQRRGARPQPAGDDSLARWLRRDEVTRIQPTRALELALAPRPPPPAGLHLLEAASGPYPATGQWARTRAGSVIWGMRCTRCNKEAGDSARWSALLKSRCGLLPELSFTTGAHNLVQQGGWHRCARCGLTCDNGHLRAARAARCPVPLLEAPGEDVAEHQAALAGELGWVALWLRAASKCEPAGEEVLVPGGEGQRPPAGARDREDAAAAPAAVPLQAAVPPGDLGGLAEAGDRPPRARLLGPYRAHARIAHGPSPFAPAAASARVTIAG